MATKLGVYNGALYVLGEGRLATITDDVKARYDLDNCYDQAVAECLEAGQWNFATLTVSVSSNATPTVHDFTYRFDKPTDWVRTCMLSPSDTFEPALERYEDEVDYWYADVDPVYVKYVSNHATNGGMLLTRWPASFTAFVEHRLAKKACMAISQDKGLFDRIDRILEPQVRKTALSRDAMNGPTRRLPEGRFVRSRYGNSVGRNYDRG